VRWWIVRWLIERWWDGKIYNMNIFIEQFISNSASYLPSHLPQIINHHLISHLIPSLASVHLIPIALAAIRRDGWDERWYRWLMRWWLRDDRWKDLFHISLKINYLSHNLPSHHQPSHLIYHHLPNPCCLMNSWAVGW